MDHIRAFPLSAGYENGPDVAFRREVFLSRLERYGIRISMDGVNRALDNIFVERFWRSLKYEDIYLNDYRTLVELKTV